MLIDQAKIYVEGGTGGKGCSSLYKDIFNRRGVPDGGDGGDGGDICFISDPNLQTLLDFRYNQHYKSDKGINGGPNNRHGRKGRDLIVKVPVGTIIRDGDTGLVVRDLDVAGEQVIVARGGKGGNGNGRKREASPGERGEEKTLLLELKLVAEVGLIGFPNAGKSTFISHVSRAQSKIADYPFTTKDPKLGMVRVEDDSFVIADMPGLIEGAHAGRGLGDKFLRHIERTCVLVHIIDAVPPDGTDPVENYRKIEKELKLYSEEVFSKPRIIVLNKMDLSDAEVSLERFKKETGIDVMAISAVTGYNVKELVFKIYRRIKDVREEKQKSDDQGRDESLDWLTE